jgi:multidrug efflux system membrane fusion protein
MTKPLLLFAIALGACSGGDKGQPGAGGGGARPPTPMKFPVEVMPVEARRVEYTVTAVGTVDAFERVQVTARVAGAVDRVLFKEGDAVKAGQDLAEIETQRYQVAVALARAGLAKAQAAVADAQAGLKRREDAVVANPGLIPGEEIESFRTRVRSAEADVAAARAALDLAAVNLRDAYVKAPVAGVIDSRTVQTGQYLQPGAVLATLVQRDPLLLRFSVPEADARRVREGMIAQFSVGNRERSRPARLTHVGGAADAQTRMVAILGEITGEDTAELRPGAFAEVAVPVGATVDAAVIPQQAVRPSERGFLSYVIEGEVAHERVLTLGMRTADGRVEVRQGLKPGELLVVRGAEALKEGAPVRVAGKEAAPATPQAQDAGRPASAGGG